MAEVLKKLVAPIAAVVALVVAAPAAAAPPCWQQVINDWWGNGRVDEVYAPDCYREALKRLPEDMQAYSDAPDAISRALRAVLRAQAALRSQQRNPTLGSSAGRSEPDGWRGAIGTDDDDATSGGAIGGGGSGGAGSGLRSGDGGGTSGSGTGASGGTSVGGGAGGAESKPYGIFQRVLDGLGPKDAASIPLPLLVLAAIAALLVAAGTAGIVLRRLRTRRHSYGELQETGTS